MDLQTLWSRMYPNFINFTELQKDEIKSIMFAELGKFQFEEKEQSTELTVYDDDMKGYTMFFVAKKVEGLGEKSLKYYKYVIDHFFSVMQKTPRQVTTDDVRYYLAVRQSKDKVTTTTIDTERRILNGFFSWLSDEDYITKNIAKPIKKVRQQKKKKKAFTDTDLIKIKDACNQLKTPEHKSRAIALVEFLLSTGCRINEISLLKKEDVDFENGTAIVFGKGSKERTVYLNAVTKMRLNEYWDMRKGNSEYAFCSIAKPYAKLNVSGLEIIVRELGEMSGVKNCHPHRFRRTMATNAIKKGMSIMDVQRMLGHESIETTKIYLDLDDSNLKFQHEKFL